MKKITPLLAIILFVAGCNPKNNQRELVHYQKESTKELGLPFSDAVIVGDLIYLSGQIGNVPGTTNLVPGGIKSEAKQTMENMKTILEANGSSLDQVIKVTVMLADINEWGSFNEEYLKYFPNKKPARSAFGADGLALNSRVEIECIALINK